jgi:hypothetical protein
MPTTPKVVEEDQQRELRVDKQPCSGDLFVTQSTKMVLSRVAVTYNKGKEVNIE